ncbi:MAG: PQQ-binding-like beta-propeller repeat protein, partial [Holophagales bacterium]|nr:PQQ-binding-like beta-propeller repeat protein [Holophagales bacterium]
MERDGHRLHLGPPAGPLARSAYALLLLAGLGSLAIPWPVWASAKEPAAEAAVDRASGKGPAADAAEAVPLPDLPEAIASFGAAVLEGSSEAEDALYVYGGHIGRTHQHSVQNLSHHFRRLSLADPSAGWQDLGDVQGLQGLAMVPHRGRVCRVGGLDARNAQDAEQEDLHSLATVACFDADTSSWAEMPPLPDPRSSHDAVVVGDSIYVVGGWQLRGAGQEAVWHDYTAVLDLAAEEPAWVNVPQPFRRRALATATAGGLVYAFGGLGEDGTSRDVDIYDPASGVWSKGPEVPAPEGRLKAFGVSAFGVGERIYLSTADGSVHALGAGAEAWNARIGELENPRFFHRLLPHRDRLLFVAGAHREGHLAGLETVQLRALEAAIENPPPAGAAAEARTLPPWPGFRGGGRGLAAPGDLPERWSEEDGVAWKVKVPGYGQSSPVIWGGQVFLTSVERPKKDTL